MAGWASLVLSFLLIGVWVQWRAQPSDTALKNAERPAAEAPDTTNAAEKALARAKAADAQAKVAVAERDRIEGPHLTAPDPKAVEEVVARAKAAEEAAARAKATVEVITRLETVLSDLRELEDAAASEAEREQIRALIELVIRGVGLQNPMNTSDPPGAGIKSDIGPAAKADNVLLTTSASVPMAAGALAVSLLGFLSTTFMTWRVDRRAIRAEARAEEEHVWKRAETSG